MKKIAILGATGHIGTALAYAMVHDDNDFSLYLFSRSSEKLGTLSELLAVEEKKREVHCVMWEKFMDMEYDVIINATGVSDLSSLKADPKKILEITRSVDDLIIEHIQKNQTTLYINMSSGAVYSAPHEIHDNMSVAEYYGFAKKESEKKHRAMPELSIVDIRIFSFFSRFIDTTSHFLMVDIVNALRLKTALITNDDDIVRDYIAPSDLLTLIKKIITLEKVNDFFDAYSREPITKFDLLQFLDRHHGLKYSIDTTSSVKKGLSSRSYYATDKKAESIGYIPKYSSLECIDEEIKVMSL